MPLCSPGLEMALGACWRVACVYWWWWHPPGVAIGSPVGDEQPRGCGCRSQASVGTSWGRCCRAGTGARGSQGAGTVPEGWGGVPMPGLAMPPSPPAPGSATAALNVVTSLRPFAPGGHPGCHPPAFSLGRTQGRARRDGDARAGLVPGPVLFPPGNLHHGSDSVTPNRDLIWQQQAGIVPTCSINTH